VEHLYVKESLLEISVRKKTNSGANKQTNSCITFSEKQTDANPAPASAVGVGNEVTRPRYLAWYYILKLNRSKLKISGSCHLLFSD